MRIKKSQNPLFVEEETYNWSTPANGVNRKLVWVSVLVLVSAALFGVLN